MLGTTFRSVLRPFRPLIRAVRRQFAPAPAPLRKERKQLSPTLLAECLFLKQFCIFVDTKDSQIGGGLCKWGCYEPHIEKKLSELLKPGMTFLDVGANIGYHTLVGAKSVGSSGRVIAVEMCPTNCQLVRESLAANRFSHVVLHETAVASSEGEVRYCATPGTSNRTVFSDSLLKHVGSESQHFVPQGTVKMTTVDRLVPPGTRIDVMKVDVEGFEAHVFGGMERIFKECQPTILLEFFPNLLRDVGGTTPENLLNLLRSHGYQLHHLDGWCAQSPPLANEELVKLAEEKTLIDLVATRKNAP